MRDLFARIAGRCVERPAPVFAAVVLVALVAAVGALKLEADAGVDQLVDEDSETFAATEQSKEAVRQSRLAGYQAAIQARRNGAGRAEARAAAQAAAEQALNGFIQQVYALALKYG